MSATDEMVSFLGDDVAPPLPKPVRESHKRKSDPDTSTPPKEWTGQLAFSVLEAVLEMERTTGHGATANDVVMRLAYSGNAPQQNSVSRRFTSLQRHGYVKDDGDRRPSAQRHGHPLIVWTSTKAGRAWLKEKRP